MHPAQYGRILRRPGVEEVTGLSRSTIYAMMAEGTFPKPMKIGKRAVGWPDSLIQAWLAERAVQSGKAA